MLSRIPQQLLHLYSPASLRQAFYLRTRWRLCPYELVESLVPEDGRILDFGCGYGLLSNFLALKSAQRRVLGIDINEQRIRGARLSVKERHNIAFFCGDFRRLRGETFDGVVMTDVLHHLSDRTVSTMLHQMHGFITGDGPLIILDVDRKPFWKFCTAALIDRCLNPGAPLFYRSRHSMAYLLARNAWAMDRPITAHRDLPLSDIIYFCRKKDRAAGAPDGKGETAFL